MILKIELDSDMHQDSNLSSYKQRRYRIKTLSDASEDDSTQLWSDPDCVLEYEWGPRVDEESKGVFYDRNDMLLLQLDPKSWLYSHMSKPPQRVADILQYKLYIPQLSLTLSQIFLQY